MKIPILPIVALLSLLALHAAQGAALGTPMVTTQAAAIFTPVIRLPLGDLFFGHLWQLEKLGSHGEERRGRGECGDNGFRALDSMTIIARSMTAGRQA